MNIATDIPRMNLNQRNALFYIDRHETADYGVIVRRVTGQSLINRGWAVEGNRRKFARESGICVRLTDEGNKLCRMIEGVW